MDIYLPIAEVSLNVFLLLGLGAAVGFLSGVFGVGGGFLLTPLLIFIGVPPASRSPRRPTSWSAPRSPASSPIGGAAMSISRWASILLLGGLAGSALGVLAVHAVEAARPGRAGDLAALRAAARHARRADAGSRACARCCASAAPGRCRRKLHQHNWMHGLPLKTRFRRSKLYISALLPAGLGLRRRRARRRFWGSAAASCWCRR